jgi:hypothetical protein
MVPITDPAKIFSTVLTAEDEQALHDIAGKMQARIDGFMEKRAYKEAASALDQFCVIDVIDNNRVTRLLQAVQVRESMRERERESYRTHATLHSH